ncbi:MAG: hypothetical protein KGO82_13975 [Bacteroidota bacterium]|nr:hypothetical protein [Bacteroidota bacterium]
MLKKLIVIFVMFVHVNGSMFLPQTAEKDIYNRSGQQERDVNTLIEFVYASLNIHQNNNPVDNDDDQGQNFHLVKLVDYHLALDPVYLRPQAVPRTDLLHYGTHPVEKIPLVSTEIVAPPPKC